MSATLRKLIHREVILAVAFVTLGFVALFLFFDFVDELQWIGRHGNKYEIRHALQFALLQIPAHIYELIPITVLIGTVFVMARLAESSEFTILRTSGLGPWRALKQLLSLGFVFAVMTLVIGDYISPAADKTGQMIKAKYQGLLTTGLTGAWLRERLPEGNITVNVANMNSESQLIGVRIFEFDEQGHVSTLTRAAKGTIGDGAWELEGANITRFSPSLQTNGSQTLLSLAAQSIDVGYVAQRASLQTSTFATGITADMVAAALLKPERMRTLDLWKYSRHLKANGQASQQFEIAFWRKVFYPVGCIVMVILALPFAYLHFRSGGITGYVFIGVLVGISFFLLNNMFGYIGNISDWEPWVAASIPSAIYLAISLSGFAWLVFRR
jgi:lipopolysaccharide export system permease protein